jgi:putative DNA primase/helicase
VARLQGIRFGVANEVEEGRRLNDKNLKKLASKQVITARELYGRIFEFMPTLKLWITTNHKPFVSDQTDGAWRRIRLVDFNNRLTKEQIDYELEDKLLSEKSGILNWLLEGCQRWISERLTMTEQIEKSGNEYRSESDVLGTFIDEYCDLGSEFKVAHKELFDSWRSWCGENGHQAGAKNGLTRKLDVRGISSKGYLDSKRAYVGIKLNKNSTGF